MPQFADRIAARLIKERDRFPGPVRRLPEHIRDHPTGLLSKLSYLAMGANVRAPAPTSAPAGAPRVLIGPAGYAGQSRMWAHAIEHTMPGARARTLTVHVPGAIRFESDTSVPFGVYHHSRRWQNAEFTAVVEGFDHVLNESFRTLFGSKFHDLRSEIDALCERGLSVALMAHGTDVRSPMAHISRTRWSPFDEDPRRDRLQATSDRNRRAAEDLGLPVFVSTPDLVDDLPFATWCPVVVDQARWMSDSLPFDASRIPVVVHAPSATAIKGTALIEPTLRALHERSLIDYRRIERVSPDGMRTVIRDADIVLDQFRIGSYGAAACEAMAAGRIVIGHVVPSVRARVFEETRRQLPIIEADAASLDSVLRAILADPAPSLLKAAQGREFVSDVHGGAFSATRLRDRWIDSQHAQAETSDPRS